MLEMTINNIKKIINLNMFSKNLVLNNTKYLNTQVLLKCNYSAKNVYLVRQSKILGKLYNEKVSGSKRKWFPSTNKFTNIQEQFNTAQKHKSGKNATRRMNVLNKLFMEHITDLIATGEISSQLIGHNLQISRVKISQDFCFISVYWVTTGDVNRDSFLETELQHCSGPLRHQLSQLCLMGVVPRIKFVKDKSNYNISQVEAILKTIDFSKNTSEADEELGTINYDDTKAEIIKQKFYGVKNELECDIDNHEIHSNKCDADKKTVIPMRYDVLGLDHKSIMVKILAKMRKSTTAWEKYESKNAENHEQPTQIAREHSVQNNCLAHSKK